jgi:hypothetical protein
MYVAVESTSLHAYAWNFSALAIAPMFVEGGNVASSNYELRFFAHGLFTHRLVDVEFAFSLYIRLLKGAPRNRHALNPVCCADPVYVELLVWRSVEVCTIVALYHFTSPPC